VPSLGNKSFQGFGLPADLARRLEDIARQVSTNQTNLDAVKSAAVTAPQAKAIADAAAQGALSVPLNISNATGIAGSPQPAAIPTVTALPSTLSAKPGQAVVYENDIWTFNGTAWAQSVTWLYADTHAHRPAAGGVVPGTVYAETDRLWIYAAEGGAWLFIGGQAYSRAQSQLVALAATLASTDAGAIVYVSDFDHKLMWTGSAWKYADSGDRSGYIQAFLVDPSPTTGWQLCDGSALVPYLKSDGSTATVTVPNLTSNAAYLKFGTPASATINPAVSPGFSGGSFTPLGTIAWPTPVPTFIGSGLAAHAHDQSSGNLGTTYFWADAPFGTGSSQTVKGDALTSGGAGSFFVSKTSAVSGGTPDGTVAWPTGAASVPVFSGSAGSVSGTIDNTGQPQNVVLRAWFRQ
jgi:hypothetical protein